jgi:hypothetical protein
VVERRKARAIPDSTGICSVMICECSSTIGWRPSSPIGMLMKAVTNPSIDGPWPAARYLQWGPI